MLLPILKRCVYLLLMGTVSAASSCAESRPITPPEASDAGVVSCVPGASGCFCNPNAGCRQGLICVAGRCLAPEGDDPDDPSNPGRPPPGYPVDGPSSRADASAPTAPDAAWPPVTDAGEPEPDASSPDPDDAGSGS